MLLSRDHVYCVIQVTGTEPIPLLPADSLVNGTVQIPLYHAFMQCLLMSMSVQ